MALYKTAAAYTRTFFLVQSADHLSALTGATPTVTLSKAGAAFGAAAGAVAEIGSGWYKVSLTTADTGTLGDLAFHITAASADDTDFVDQIVAVDLQDAVAFGLSRIDAAVSSRMATFTLPTNFSALSITAGGLIDITQTAADKVWGSATRTLTAFSTALAVSVWDVLDANIATASSVGLRLKGLTFTTANKVDATIQAAGDFAQGAADKVWSTATRTLTAFGFSVTVGTNNDKTGYALSAAGVQAIWDALTSALTTVGSIGKLLVDNINATISSRSTYAGADTAGTTTLLSRLTGTRATNLDNLDATVSSRSTFAGGAVASVTGAVGSIAAGGIVTSSFGVGAIDSVAFSQAAADRVLASVVEGTVTLKQSQQLANAANAGIVAGAATTSVTIKGMDDTTTRVAATVDANGNRTAVTRTYS